MTVIDRVPLGGPYLNEDRDQFTDALANTLNYSMTAKAPPHGLAPHRAPLKVAGGAPHWYIPASDRTAHWGYFSKHLAPLVKVKSGSYLTIECVTNNASDDYDRLIKGDPGAESIFYWTRQQKNIDRRGSGPLDAGVGAGGGRGAHICTGPIYVHDAKPGDVLEVRIVDMYPRRSGNPRYRGRAFGVNIAGRWGFHCADALSESKDREVITVYEIDTASGRNWARALYSFPWTPVRDPFGVVHAKYDYPGLVVDHRNVEATQNFLQGVRIPLRPHFGIVGVAPGEADMVSSGPPNYTGGNIDNWRAGKGATIYLPVSVEGALLSVGDAHAAQGDGEISGSAIESSWTGFFKIVLHKQNKLGATFLDEVNYPLLENKTQWIVQGFSHPNYVAELGADAPREAFANATIDSAMRDAYRKMRNLLLKAYQFGEDEVTSLMSLAVDFGVTQVVDANLGVHAILDKRALRRRPMKRP